MQGYQRNGILFVILFFGISNFALSQSKTNLSEVVVSANRTDVGYEEAARNVTVISRKEIESAPVESINELLEYASNVDIRQRGIHGVQADVSIRGSSFEQVLILLNGIKMTDPQTGHHNLNLPIELMDIERIEILQGGGSRVFGPGAFAGAINIITKNPEESKVKLLAEAGDFGFKQLGGAASLNLGKHSHTFSLSERKSDGYIRNTDFSISNLFWQSEVHLKKSDWFLNLGQTNKSFGAQNFYTARFPEQFEETQTQFISAGGEYRWNETFTLKPKVYYRKHNDRFELFRESFNYYSRIPQGGFANSEGDTISWYQGHNYHQTDVFGFEFNLSATTKFGVTSVGFDYRDESIKSNVLGLSFDSPEPVEGEHPSALYLRGDSRVNQSLFLEHNAYFKKVFLSAGFLFNSNSDFGQHFMPGFDISYELNKVFRPYGSINKSFRLPTYTDLYYNLGGAIGSLDLTPEESLNYELGTKFSTKSVQGHVAYFLRDGQNLIDWIRYSGSDTTRAANITEVKISGFEADMMLKVEALLGKSSVLKTAGFSYTYLFSGTNSSDFESNYVLDFLQHKLDIRLGFIFEEFIHLDWMFSFQDRKGDYTNETGQIQSFEPFLLSDIRVAPQLKNFKLFIQVSNLFDLKYVDIGNVQQPGRWFRAGVIVDFNINTPKK